jgi:hypothetical protein
MPTSSKGWVPLLDNLHPALEQAWHPVALSRELKPGGWLQVRLLGRTWLLRRTDGGLVADPPAHEAIERHGAIWLAPAGPRDRPLDIPELADRRFLSGWLPPLRSPGPAASLADAVLDAAQPAPPGKEEPMASLVEEPDGFTGVTEAAGARVTVAFRVPFQLRIRAEDTASGAARTVVLMLQPEDGDSTRLYARLLLSAGPGRPLPAPGDVVQQMAAVHDRLEDEARLMADIGSPGLLLGPRDELPMQGDGMRLALRRALSEFIAAGRRDAA